MSVDPIEKIRDLQERMTRLACADVIDEAGMKDIVVRLKLLIVGGFDLRDGNERNRSLWELNNHVGDIEPLIPGLRKTPARVANTSGAGNREDVEFAKEVAAADPAAAAESKGSGT